MSHIALLTAGGAGMFCGSCMHDNTLARAWMECGHEVTLIPTYTPIRVDEDNVSQSRVFLGGINVYLDAVVPLWRFLPRAWTRWLDSPRVIRLATRWGVSSNAQKLGKLTVALLQGPAGPHLKLVNELAEFLGRSLRPDVVCYSNALLAGTLPALKRVYRGRVFCLLQGDDIFLKDLLEPYQSQVLDLLRQLAQQFDGFLVHSQYYRDEMSALLDIPLERMHVIPLGIDLQGHDGEPCAMGTTRSPGVVTIGYFARICPEKGLHLLVDAVRLLRREHPQVRLQVGGYLGARDEAYFAEVLQQAAELGSAFEYIGSPSDHARKVQFLKSLDIFSVPTTYREPKGLSILEALANGVPVVQPAHGAFPEMLAQTEGGLLFEPGNVQALAQGLSQLIADPAERHRLATKGHRQVHAQFSQVVTAQVVADCLLSSQTVCMPGC